MIRHEYIHHPSISQPKKKHPPQVSECCILNGFHIGRVQYPPMLYQISLILKIKPSMISLQSISRGASEAIKVGESKMDASCPGR